ncbi:MAG: tetratricopeptide repeat protein [Spirochaetaceae bacterium]|jgi:putative GTP pyrophosphokinase|nr:tetratricopeptide repeat protein [Spirochaetaceae bacterium]
MKRTLPNHAALRRQYEEDYETRGKIVKDIERYLEQSLSQVPSHLTIKGRVKSFQSFYQIYLRYLRKTNTDKTKIPDEIGVRVVCPFLEDIDTVEGIIKKNFEVIEVEEKGGMQLSFKEFGYESRHLLVRLPPAIGEKYQKKQGGTFSGEIAEIQLRTNLQDAWAEVEHELVYKAKFSPLDSSMRRKLAAINATLSLADTIFQEFRSYQKQLNTQLEKRRSDFYLQIEEFTSAFLVDTPKKEAAAAYIPREINSGSIDDLLLNALYAHNKARFEEARTFYSQILELRPDEKLKALVYKHRGMANFAQSNYDGAIEDFNRALEFDGSSHQSAYYLGVVHSCKREYAQAIDAFTRSIKIDPFQKYCFLRRAQCSYHINDYPNALSDCESAISLDAEFDAAKRFKQLLLDKLKM